MGHYRFLADQQWKMFRTINIHRKLTTKAKQSKLYKVAVLSLKQEPLVYTTMKVTDILHFGSNQFYTRDLLSFDVVPDDSDDKHYYERGLVSRPSVLARGEHILVSFGHIRALIGRKGGLLFNAHQPRNRLFAQELSNTLTHAMYSSSSRNPSKVDDIMRSSYEFVFFEEILREICDTYQRRYMLFKPVVKKLLPDDNYDDSNATLEMRRVVPLKDALQSFEMEVSEAKQVLQEIIASDEKMLSLLITEQELARRRGEKIDEKLHQNVEYMLEDYIRQLQHLKQNIQFLMKSTQSKLEFLEMSMDAFRNRLIKVNVHMSILSVSLATGTVVAGFFGMNVIHGLENAEMAFPAIIVGSSALGAGIFFVCSEYLSGSWARRSALRKIDEIETMNKMLGDVEIASLDLAVKVLENSHHNLPKDETVDLDDFRRELHERTSQTLTKEEIQFLISSMDIDDDGKIHRRELLLFNGHDDNDGYGVSDNNGDNNDTSRKEKQ